MLASLAKEGNVVHFSGFARKMNDLFSFPRAKRARLSIHKKCHWLEKRW
ncbi:MAG: hypothetical protein U5L45_07330 [Saprospiraceae bacterium]|nr:hypothetical protein [Saprospiraceae bacterium]